MFDFEGKLRAITVANGGTVQADSDGRLVGAIAADGRGIAWNAPAGASPDHEEVRLAARAFTLKLIEANEIAKINADTGLSETGKAARRAKIAEESSAQLAANRRSIDALLARHALSDEADLRAPALAQTDLVGALIDQELRANMRSMSLGQLGALAQELLNGNQTRFLDAIDRSPLPLPDIIEKVRAGAREATLLRNDPIRARQASQGRERVEWVKLIADQADFAMSPQGGSREEQYVRAQADAMQDRAA